MCIVMFVIALPIEIQRLIRSEMSGMIGELIEKVSKIIGIGCVCLFSKCRKINSGLCTCVYKAHHWPFYHLCDSPRVIPKYIWTVEVSVYEGALRYSAIQWDFQIKCSTMRGGLHIVIRPGGRGGGWGGHCSTRLIVVHMFSHIDPPFSALETARLGEFCHRQHTCRFASQLHKPPHTHKIVLGSPFELILS